MARVVRVDIPEGPTPALRWITAINLAVFALWQLAITAEPWAESLMATVFTVDADLVRGGAVWTLLGSAFSHYAFGHLFFNLYAMWLFGRDVELVVGSRGFVHLYVAGGIAASLGHVAFNLATGEVVPALGASGSVMAIAMVSALLFPNRLLLVLLLLPMRQITAVGLFVLADLIGMLSPRPDTIAHAAHLGGALYGFLYYRHRLRHYLQERQAAWRAARRRKTPQGSPWDHPVA